MSEKKNPVDQLMTMEFANPFRQRGRWYKGNTHTHTNNSDGTWTVEDVRREYGRHGYDFVFLTDHWRRTVPPSSSRGRSPLLIAAEEVDFILNGDIFHAVCLGIKREWDARGFKSMADFIREARRRCRYLIMAHPYWSASRSEMYLGAGGFDATEVYNTAVDRAIAKGYSNTYWDDFLQTGMRVMGIAADDAHSAAGAFGGWLMVKAAACTESALMKAIRQGMFYATQGPELRDIRVAGRRITVKCSPVRRVNFVGHGYTGAVIYAGRKDLTEASWEMPLDLPYVRIECVDRNGRMAWSNPFRQKWDLKRLTVLQRKTRPRTQVPRLGATAGGNPDRIDWTGARVLKKWWTLMGETSPRRIDVRLIHDGRYLYIQLEEQMDPRRLIIRNNGVWDDDEWELFFSDRFGKPCRQMGVNANGVHKALDHGPAGCAWTRGATVRSNRELRDRWQVRLALPLATLVDHGARSGSTVYMNIIRSTTVATAAAWVPTFRYRYYNPTRMGTVSLT